MVNRKRYFRALAQELGGLKNRVRDLKEDNNWVTDGEWKESVLRTILKRHVPATATVGRGFVVASDFESTQIDILIHDSSRPVLFRDGDLVFVTPDAVLGIIEVKSRVDLTGFRVAAAKLGTAVGHVRRHTMYSRCGAFAALFAYESAAPDDRTILDATVRTAQDHSQLLDFVAIGSATFIRYWAYDPLSHDIDPRMTYEAWHIYNLPEMAAGYFIHNVIESLSPQSVGVNNDVWFPLDGKEGQMTHRQKAQWNTFPF